MAVQDKQLLAFNRGVVSKIGLARIDVERLQMSAEIQSNWIPRVLGSMMFRPGWKFIDFLNNGAANTGRLAPFTFGVDDQALLEFSPSFLQVIDPATDTRIPTVSGAAPASQTVNGNFTSDITSWVDASQVGGSVTWLVGGYAGMKGDGTDFGILRQTVTVAGPDQGLQHNVLVRVVDGPVRFKVGSTAGDDDYVEETRLDRGEHELTFTPTGNFTIEFANEREFNVRVTQCTMQNSGDLSVVTPWATATDRDNMRWDQSGDVMYFAADGVRLQKIERRGDGTSWSVADYLPEDGPFRVQNVSGITLTPSALNGDITLTASEGIFKQGHADNRSIWRIGSQGQTVTKAISGADDFTDPIRVVGTEDARVFSIIIEGTFVATVTLQFAFSKDGPWNDTSPQYTVPTSVSFDDGQDEQIIFYRLGVKAGDYTSGTVTATLNYTGGSIQGVARVIGFTSTTVVDAQVLKDFGAIDASKDWWEGEWSDVREWPTAVSIHEGRLWWAGRDRIWSSVSDLYESFDDNTVGDSAPISRSIGFGPIRVIHWLMSMGRLLFGTADNSHNIAPAKMDGNQPLGARSNSFDEPLTPSNFNIKSVSSRGVFIDRTEQRLYELAYDIDQQDYKPIDLSVFAPDFNEVGVVRVAAQMKPDIRIHCVRSDGTVGMLVYDRLENVIAWVEVNSTTAGGEVEDVAVLPGRVEDQVYYIVKRTINSATARHIVKWALESEAIGGTVSKIADDFAVYSGAATTSPFTTELLHLRDETVVIWADGADVGTKVVSSTGGLTLDVAASDVVAGLSYTAQFKSAKLGTITGIGLLKRKKVNRIGLIAQNMHYQGLQYGQSFDSDELNDLPLVEQGQETADDFIWDDYHEDDFSFGGDWKPDSRICLQAAAPRPCTLLAAIAEMETLEKPSRRR